MSRARSRLNSPVHPLQKSGYILYTLAGRRQTPVIVPARVLESERVASAIASTPRISRNSRRTLRQRGRREPACQFGLARRARFADPCTGPSRPGPTAPTTRMASMPPHGVRTHTLSQSRPAAPRHAEPLLRAPGSLPRPAAETQDHSQRPSPAPRVPRSFCFPPSAYAAIMLPHVGEDRAWQRERSRSSRSGTPGPLRRPARSHTDHPSSTGSPTVRGSVILHSA